MKPFETADHLRVLFHNPMMDNSGRLKLVERLREDAIVVLQPITPEELDLKNFRHADYLYADLVNKDAPGTIPYRDALHLLRECTSALESGTVGKRHIELIPRFYAGLDKRLTGGAVGIASQSMKAADERAEAQKLADDIWTAHKRKPSIRELWRQVAEKLYPNLSGEEFAKAADNLRKRNQKWKPAAA